MITWLFEITVGRLVLLLLFGYSCAVVGFFGGWKAARLGRSIPMGQRLSQVRQITSRISSSRAA